MKKLILLTVLLLLCITLNEAKRSKASRFQQEDQENQPKNIASRSQSKPQQRSSSLSTKRSKSSKNSLKHSAQQHHYLHPYQVAFWWNLFLAIALSCGGGFFSGMTVGLNSLDKLSLQVQQMTGNEQQKKVASRILNTINDHHLFLVTLLIGNAMVLQWLPLVVHKIMPDWAAILTSTVAVVIVAEIVPMSATTGPNKVQLAYIGSPLVDICIKIYYIVAYPIARGLDQLLGVHDTSKIKRRDFLALVNDKKKNYLRPLEIGIFNQLFVGPKFTSVEQLMTPTQSVLVLSLEDQINSEIISQLENRDIQCILVAKRKEDVHNLNICTYVKPRQLVFSYLKFRMKNPNSKITLSQLIQPVFPINPHSFQLSNHKNKQEILVFNKQHKIPVVYCDTGLLDLLGILSKRNAQLALVHRDRRRNESTDIAYLDASDQELCYDPFSQEDKHKIIGIISIQQAFEAIADFNHQITPQFEKHVEDSPPKKRKLVKRASIISSFSIDDK